MTTRQLTGIVCAALVLLHPTAQVMVQADTKQSVEDIRKELLQLPYYSVFDFLAFSYDRGTVVVGGYAYALGLKKDAERAIKRASGVDTVVNKIEELPPNPIDDQIRWATYYKIYRDPFLSRYAPGGGLLWGHRHAFRGPFSPYGGAFPGMEPAGDYPIHIIVKNGRVTLLGVVDSENDKTVAGLRAREVPGTFDVANQLVVEGSGKRSSEWAAHDEWSGPNRRSESTTSTRVCKFGFDAV